MKTPYYTIPFSFSEESLKWIKKRTDVMVEDYQRNAPLDAALIDQSGEVLQEWYDSPMWQEALTQLAPMGLQTTPTLQFFIYKKLNAPNADIRGNPHIDTYQGVSKLVPIRFNILLAGEENQEMVWWDVSLARNDILQVVKFPRPNAPPGTMSERIQVRGETKSDKWYTAGEPEYSCSTLTKFNEYASFVRTDILHALKWTGNQPRLIMSIKWHEPWHMIEKFIKE